MMNWSVQSIAKDTCSNNNLKSEEHF